MRLSIGALALTAVAVAVAALLAVSKPEGGKADSTQSAGVTHQVVASTGEGSSSVGHRVLAATRGANMAPLHEAATQTRQRVNLEIRTTEVLNGEEQPRYVPEGATAASLKSWKGNITVKQGETVLLTIVNTDDGSAELLPGYRQFDYVQGGTETVDGTPVRSVANGDIAHTFTVMGLGVNAAIPAAPEGATNKIVLRFTPKKTGTFSWTCLAPCGIGNAGLGGAMDTPGWMEGRITVVS